MNCKDANIYASGQGGGISYFSHGPVCDHPRAGWTTSVLRIESKTRECFGSLTPVVTMACPLKDIKGARGPIFKRRSRPQRSMKSMSQNLAAAMLNINHAFSSRQSKSPPPHARPNTFGNLGLSIIGLGTQYPDHELKPEALDRLAKRHYPDTPA